MSLELEYAYGYNGGLWSNLTAAGDKLAYCLAGVGVVLNPEDLTQTHFRSHSEDVLCIAKNPAKKLLATGQRDPKDGTGAENKPYVCIWNQETMEERYRIREFFDREVCSVGFTFDGNYIFAIGGDDSHIGGFFSVGKVSEDGDAYEVDMKRKSKPIFSQMTSKDAIFGQSHAPGKVDDAYQFVTFGNKMFKWWSVDPSSGDEKFKTCKPSTNSQTNISQSYYSCAAWTPSNDLLLGCQSGHIYVFSSADKTLQKWWDTGNSPVRSLSIVSDGYRAITSKGHCLYYDFEHNHFEDRTVKVGKKVVASTDIVNSDESSTTYVGCKDGSILSLGAEGKMETLIQGHTKEIWALATHPSKSWLVIGSEDGKLRVWDFNKKEVVFQLGSSDFEFSKGDKKGFMTADFNRQGTELALGCFNGDLIVVNSDQDEESKAGVEFGQIVQSLKKVCKEEISAVGYTRDGSKLVLGSWDQTVRILDKDKNGKWKGTKKGKLTGHTSSICQLCISEDGTLLRTNSKDAETLYWDVEERCRLKETPDCNTIWDRWNCVYGWPVQGLFHKAGDITDVNCCEISGNNSFTDDTIEHKAIASGDDSGRVSLFKFPSLITPKNGKGVKEYFAHSAHVTNVRWAEDDSYLFSAGGGDLAVFQWKVVN